MNPAERALRETVAGQMARLYSRAAWLAREELEVEAMFVAATGLDPLPGIIDDLESRRALYLEANELWLRRWLRISFRWMREEDPE